MYVETEETVSITVSFVLDINMTVFLMSYTFFTDKFSQVALLNPTTFDGNNAIEEWRIPSLSEGAYGLIAKTRCISEEKKHSMLNGNRGQISNNKELT